MCSMLSNALYASRAETCNQRTGDCSFDTCSAARGASSCNLPMQLPLLGSRPPSRLTRLALMKIWSHAHAGALNPLHAQPHKKSEHHHFWHFNDFQRIFKEFFFCHFLSLSCRSPKFKLRDGLCRSRRPHTRAASQQKQREARQKQRDGL